MEGKERKSQEREGKQPEERLFLSLLPTRCLQVMGFDKYLLVMGKENGPVSYITGGLSAGHAEKFHVKLAPRSAKNLATVCRSRQQGASSTMLSVWGFTEYWGLGGTHFWFFQTFIGFSHSYRIALHFLSFLIVQLAERWKPQSDDDSAWQNLCLWIWNDWKLESSFPG